MVSEIVLMQLPNDAKVKKQSSRSSVTKSTSRTHEKTSSNRTADGNHVEMALLHGLVELVVLIGHCSSALERLGRESQARPDAQLLVRNGIIGLGVVVDRGSFIAAAGLDGALLDDVGLFSHGDVEKKIAN